MVLANRLESGRRASTTAFAGPRHSNMHLNQFFGLGLVVEFQLLLSRASVYCRQRTNQTLCCFRLAHDCPKFHQPFVGATSGRSAAATYTRFFPASSVPPLVPGRDASPVSRANTRSTLPSTMGTPPQGDGSNRPGWCTARPQVGSQVWRHLQARRRHVVQQWQEPRRAACGLDGSSPSHSISPRPHPPQPQPWPAGKGTHREKARTAQPRVTPVFAAT